MVSRSDVWAADTSAARILGHVVPSQVTPAAVSLPDETSNCAADAGTAATSIAATRARNVLVQRIITSLLTTEPNSRGPAPAPNVRPGSVPRSGEIRVVRAHD